jgi:hypothetical protein
MFFSFQLAPVGGALLYLDYAVPNKSGSVQTWLAIPLSIASVTLNN